MVAYTIIQGGHKKVSHYHYHHKNVLKTVSETTFFINFDYKMSKRM